MKIKYLLFPLLILTFGYFFGSCSDPKTNDTIFTMHHLTYLLENGVDKKIALKGVNENGYRISQGIESQEIFSQHIEQETNSLIITPKKAGEASITVLAQGFTTIDQHYINVIIFPKGTLILYPYSYNKQKVKLEVDKATPQYFVNGEGKFSAKSSNENVAVAEVVRRTEEEDTKKQIRFRTPPSVLPDSETNKDWVLVVSAFAKGKTTITVNDELGRENKFEIEVTDKK